MPNANAMKRTYESESAGRPSLSLVPQMPAQASPSENVPSHKRHRLEGKEKKQVVIRLINYFETLDD